MLILYLVLVPVLVKDVCRVLPVFTYGEEALLHVEGAAGHQEQVEAALGAAELTYVCKTYERSTVFTKVYPFFFFQANFLITFYFKKHYPNAHLYGFAKEFLNVMLCSYKYAQYILVKYR